ncbi:MAG: tRNA guanosine(34) transglycosylase Tgt [Bacteroidetes bacterium]|nr:tRNA guanosine(34) transglycosylase Tgt [Bacteroidota bacterium]
MHVFIIEKKAEGSQARAGVLSTGHGEIPTPIFMPVGTLGTVKAIHQRELKADIDAKIILGNTYHLYLRPGTEILNAAGGLHSFMNWDRPILTDSGGYQLFSLTNMRKISEQGAVFQSHIDGSKHTFSPESVIDIQRKIGGDIIMAFDECPPYPASHDYVKKSLELTQRWLVRCRQQMDSTEPLYGHHQALFPIVQGGVYSDLRKQSAAFIADLPNVEGVAIGGLSVGEPAEMMYEQIEHVCPLLPENKPRYLMGVGTPENLLEGIERGIDMFDCVMPARNGRNGMLFTWKGIFNMKNKKWEKDFSPIDETSSLFSDQEYSKAYLRHLFTVNERLAAQIATLHNLHFYLDLMKQARLEILAGTFAQWKKTMLPILNFRN